MCGFERTARPDNGGPLMPSEDTDQIAARIAQKLRDAGSSAILYPAPTATTLGAIRRDRVVVVVSLALLAAFAWSYLLWFSVDMGMGGMDLTGFRIIPSGMGLMMPTHTPSRAIEFAFVFAMWTVMMVGMMTPSAMPMILMYARVGRHAEAQGTPLVATVWFVAGYLLVWVAFALLATLVQGALEHTALLDSAMVNTNNILGGLVLGCVDGFDQDEAESKRDERAVILRRLLASKCDTLEAFELADSLFNACPCLVECFRKGGGHILGVGSIRDCRTYSALARGVAV